MRRISAWTVKLPDVYHPWHPDDYDVVVGQQMVEDYELSHYVEISSITTATKTAIHDYMAAKWAGTSTYVAGEHAGFFSELEINVR